MCVFGGMIGWFIAVFVGAPSSLVGHKVLLIASMVTWLVGATLMTAQKNTKDTIRRHGDPADSPDAKQESSSEADQAIRGAAIRNTSASIVLISTKKFAARKALELDIPLDLALALIQTESNWNVNARGKAGEYGLCQVREIAVKDLARDDVEDPDAWKTDPFENITVGLAYLKLCHVRAARFADTYDERWRYALYAYNWGIGNVTRYVKGEIGLPLSVQRYADRILAEERR